MAGEQGFEPQLPGSEPGVLPLDDSPKGCGLTAAETEVDGINIKMLGGPHDLSYLLLLPHFIIKKF